MCNNVQKSFKYYDVKHFLNGSSLASFVFSAFSKNNIFNKSMWKNVHQVSGAGIQTHDFLIMSLPL